APRSARITRPIDGITRPIDGITRPIDGITRPIDGITRRIDRLLSWIEGLLHRPRLLLHVLLRLRRGVGRLLARSSPSLPGRVRAFHGGLRLLRGLAPSMHGPSLDCPPRLRFPASIPALAQFARRQWGVPMAKMGPRISRLG